MGGCIVWGGAINLAPADDVIISAERPLALDSFLIPSILAKKYAVGSNYVVIDMPLGKDAKIKSMKTCKKLFRQFKLIGKRLGIKANGVVTNASQHLGTTVGPALEAKEVLEVLLTKNCEVDFVRKACYLFAVIFNMVKGVDIEDGLKLAVKTIKRGRVEEKLRDIIKAQGGDPKIEPKDIEVGGYSKEFRSKSSGYITQVDIKSIRILGRAAGAPFDRGAGLKLNKKIGDYVKRGDVLFTVHTERKNKLKECEKLMKHLSVYTIGKYKPRVKDVILSWLR